MKGRMVDAAKSQSKMVTVEELSLDSFKHLPLETWALEPENTYKGANGKVYPWTCRGCTKKKLKGVSRLEKPKAERAGTLCLAMVEVPCWVRLRREEVAGVGVDVVGSTCC